jgi:ribokinase
MDERTVSRSRVLVVGDANPDLVLRGDVEPRFGQAEQLLEHAAVLIGGSAGIAAHAFARLGRPVSLLAAIGADVLGSAQRDELAAAGVATELLLERATTPTGITVVLSRGPDRAILTFPGAIPTLTADEVRDALARTTDVCHVHVAALYLQPRLVATLAPVLAQARAAGCTVSLDTNDDPAATWAGMAELLPHVDVLLPNTHEAIALAGSRSHDPVDAARELARQGPLVVVKDGASGAHAVRPDGSVVTAAGRDVPVVDTTGAGDTFDAAFLDHWLAGVDLTSCVHRAVRAGCYAVGAVGGTAGQPTAAHLDSPSEPIPLESSR